MASASRSFECCFCKETFEGFGNNPAPLGKVGEKCCDECNIEHVIRARLKEARAEAEKMAEAMAKAEPAKDEEKPKKKGKGKKQ